jgi:hypothetical protein
VFRKPVLIVAVAIATVSAFAVAAYAATGVSSPTPLRFTVPGDSGGAPQSVTIAASGFAPGAPVFIEQCNGVDPTSTGWSPTSNCDLGSSPSPVNAGDDGTATFPANDPNFGFTAFKGESPQSLFNCLAANQPSPANGLTDYRNCQVRLSTNNVVVTSDQVFFQLALPDAPDPSAAAGTCTLGQGLVSVKTATVGAGITDHSQDVSMSGRLFQDISTPAHTPLGGTCTGLIDSHYASPTIVAANAPQVTKGTLHAAKLALSLKGASSCVWNAPGIAADSAYTAGYKLSGTLAVTFSELNSLGKPFSLSASVQMRHSLTKSDVYDFKGVVTKGLSIGATVSGSGYLDSVAKFGGTVNSITSNAGPIPPTLPSSYTGYGLDTVGGKPSGCDDGIANNTTSPAKVVAPATRTDVATVTLGSHTVADASIQASDLHRAVTGTGIPGGTFVGSVIPGTSFTLSSSISSSVFVNATSAGTSVKIGNVAFNIKAQTGILTYQLGSGASLLGNAATGLTLSF